MTGHVELDYDELRLDWTYSSGARPVQHSHVTVCVLYSTLHTYTNTCTILDGHCLYIT